MRGNSGGSAKGQNAGQSAGGLQGSCGEQDIEDRDPRVEWDMPIGKATLGIVPTLVRSGPWKRALRWPYGVTLPGCSAVFPGPNERTVPG